LNPFIVFTCQLCHLFQGIKCIALEILKILILERRAPADLIEIEEHFLFKLILSVVQCNRVIVLAEAVCNCN
jgi:hypothetical protein